MNEWTIEELPLNAGGRACVFHFLVPVTIGGIANKAVVALGYDTNNADEIVWLYSLGQAFFQGTIQDAGPDVGPYSVAPGTVGEFLCGLNIIIARKDELGTGTYATLGGFAGGPIIHYAPGPGRYIVNNGSGTFYHGLTFAGITGPVASPPMTDRLDSTLGLPGGAFVDDGGDNVLYYGSCTVGGVVRFRAFHSADGGQTWSAPTLTCAATATGLSIIWCAEAGTFWALDSDGERYASATGSAFASAGAVTGITAAAGAATRHGTMACVGRCIAKAFAPDYYAGVKGSGIAYTFDLGDTWRVVPIADVDAYNFQEGLASLIAANGRFYAITREGGHVFKSGVIAFEAADL